MRTHITLIVIISTILFSLSKPAAAKWIKCDGLETFVEKTSALKGFDVEVYPVARLKLAIVKIQTQETIACISLKPQWRIVGFRTYQDFNNPQKKITAVAVQQGGKWQYFSIENGKEMFIMEDAPTDQDNSIFFSNSLPPPPQKSVSVIKKLSGGKSQITAQEFHRITDVVSWEKLYDRHKPGEPPPLIDFTHHMVIAIFAGRQINSSGLEALNIIENDDKIIFKYQSKVFYSPDGNYARQPFGIFVVPHSNKKIEFMESTRSLGLSQDSLGWRTTHEMNPLE